MVPNGSDRNSPQLGSARPRAGLGFPRTLLFIYFMIILLTSIHLIANFWKPSDLTTVKNFEILLDQNKTDITVPITDPGAKAISNASNITLPASTVSNISVTTTNSENSTTKTETIERFLVYNNGTKQLVDKNQTAEPKESDEGYFGFFLQFLPLQSDDKEVRLVAVSVLFGILGACISGIASVFNRRLWVNGRIKGNNSVYLYIARPWFGTSVAIVTYVTLRAGLINVGSTPVISEYGVAAIAALVGLMSDEMITRLRDVFKTFLGLPRQETETQELVLSLPQESISKGDEITISAILPELKPAKDLNVYFFIEKPGVIEIKRKDDKFNDYGLATAILEGKEVGETFISVMAGDLKIYDSQRIIVKETTEASA